jgi:colicin import membrane protein
MLSYLNPMNLLLRAQGYPPAVLFSFGLHFVVVLILWDHDFVPEDMVNLDKPEFVSATVIQENPQKLRRLENERQQVANDAAQQRAREQEAARQREEQNRQQAQRDEAARQERERLAREQAQRDQAQREQAEREQAQRDQAQREREAAERQQAESAERERQEAIAREQQAQREAQARAAEEQASATNQAVQSYTAVIYNAISRNWVVPPSARNGMTVQLKLSLVPTGEVINVEITKFSGDDAFDRSALTAVAKAERFPELQQMPSRLFETQFRTVFLTFRPEDLLR